MKALLIVLLQSLVLTIFITLMAQAYIHRVPSMTCHGDFFNTKKCASSVEAMRGSWR